MLLTKVQAQMCWSRVESSSFEEAEMESDDGEDSTKLHFAKVPFPGSDFPFFFCYSFSNFF